MYQFMSSTNPQQMQETDNSLHAALRNAESLLTDNFYGGMHRLEKCQSNASSLYLKFYYQAILGISVRILL